MSFSRIFKFFSDIFAGQRNFPALVIVNVIYYNGKEQTNEVIHMINIPSGASMVMKRLTDAGFQAYVVGGCVRDSLLGKTPKDWDICTSATPEEMQQVFAGCHVVETGLQHGTLTVVVNHEPYEVTTFRVDGEYTDHRHPDQVIFVRDVREDLARRDFTVNAMAYHPDAGLVDAFHGQEDLKRQVIRCVGKAEKRFEEDALRILRALRFAAVYGFSIESETAQAAHQLKHTLRDVAAERICVELTKMLCGAGVGTILRAYVDVVAEVLPALKPTMGNAAWEHTVQTVECVPAIPALRWAALLHASGTDVDCTEAAQHRELATTIAMQTMTQLKIDHATRDRVLLLTSNCNLSMSEKTPLLRRRLHQFGEEALRQLLKLQRANELSMRTSESHEINARFDGIEQALNDLAATNPCVTLKQLAVNGVDLMAAGIPKGQMIGRTLNALLDKVLDETLPNVKSVLLAEASAMLERS